MSRAIYDIRRRPAPTPRRTPAHGTLAAAAPLQRVLDLQRTAGNHAVVALLAGTRRPTVSSPTLQRLSEEQVESIKEDKKKRARFFAAQTIVIDRTKGDGSHWNYLVGKASSLEELEALANATPQATTTTTTSGPLGGQPKPSPPKQQQAPTPKQQKQEKETEEKEPIALGGGKKKTKWKTASTSDFITGGKEQAWGATTSTVVSNLGSSNAPFTPLAVTAPQVAKVPTDKEIRQLINRILGYRQIEHAPVMGAATQITDDTIYFPVTLWFVGEPPILLEVHFHPAGPNALVGQNVLHIKPLGHRGGSTANQVWRKNWLIQEALLDAATARWKAGDRGYL